MTPKEAFDLLGLPITASLPVINRGYKKKASKAHPDAGGDTDDMAKLSQAYDIASTHAKNRIPVLIRPNLPARPTSPGRQRPIQVSEQRRENQERTRELAVQIVTLHVANAATLRRRATFLGAMAVAVAVISARILPVTDRLPTYMSVPLLTLTVILSLLLAAARWHFSVAADNAQAIVTDLSARLNNRTRLLSVIQGLASRTGKQGGVPSSFSYYRLLGALPDWAEDEHDQYYDEMAEVGQTRPTYRTKHQGAFIQRQAKRLRYTLRRLKLWVRRRLYKMVTPTETPLFSLAHSVGNQNFLELVLAKGIEHDLIVERVVMKGDRYSVEYAFKQGANKSED
jgi:hypothetical protein